jgi:hypothetical protein
MAEVSQKMFLGTDEVFGLYDSKWVGINPYEAPIVYDTDAQAFLTATGITDPTISNAINTLVVSLKADTVWTKILALYPFVGGTATTNKYNLKNPADTNAAYRLSFAGTWTHAANGSTPNGASGTYADTFLSPSVSPLTATNGFIYYYCPQSYAAGESIDVGSGDFSSSGESTIATRWSDDLTYYIWYNSAATNGFFTVATTNTTGHWMLNKTGTGVQGWKNGVKQGTSATNGLNTNNLSLYLGARRTPSGNDRNSPRRHVTTSIGEGLTDAQGLALYNAINTFNTTLGR